jgi:hypothetical protein
MTDTAYILSEPIIRKEGDISSVTLRKPGTGDLRGLMLTKVLQMDVNTLLVLLPRITSPALLPDEVAGLDPADLLGLSGRVVDFFMTARQRAQAEAELRLT